MEWDGILANLPLDIRTFIFTRYRGRGRRRKFPPLSDILSISRGIFKWPEQQQVVNPFFKGFSLGTGSVRGREGEGNSYGTVPPSLPSSSRSSRPFSNRARFPSPGQFSLSHRCAERIARLPLGVSNRMPLPSRLRNFVLEKEIPRNGGKRGGHLTFTGS